MHVLEDHIEDTDKKTTVVLNTIKRPQKSTLKIIVKLLDKITPELRSFRASRVIEI